MDCMRPHLGCQPPRYSEQPTARGAGLARVVKIRRKSHGSVMIPLQTSFLPELSQSSVARESQYGLLARTPGKVMPPAGSPLPRLNFARATAAGIASGQFLALSVRSRQGHQPSLRGGVTHLMPSSLVGRAGRIRSGAIGSPDVPSAIWSARARATARFSVPRDSQRYA